MRKKNVQMSLEDIYNDVLESIEKKESNMVSLLEEHIDLNEIIPESFQRAFYNRMGRNHIYHLDSFLWFVILKNFFCFSQNTQMINVLKCSRELRDLCGFEKVPDASQITRFLKNYCNHIENTFEHLVEITEPICRKINRKKVDDLIFDTTGIEAKVAENNPKFFNTKLKQAKSLKTSDTSYNPYAGVYSLLPSESETNPEIRQQYINGHFCYALKAGIITNGIGIVRHISVFDQNFKNNHTYPDKNFRLYHGIPRGTKHWDNLYKHRVTIERTINLLKDSFVLSDNKSFHTVSLKADLFLSGIVQLLGVLLADNLHSLKYFKSIRKLLAA